MIVFLVVGVSKVKVLGFFLSLLKRLFVFFDLILVNSWEIFIFEDLIGLRIYFVCWREKIKSCWIILLLKKRLVIFKCVFDIITGRGFEMILFFKKILFYEKEYFKMFWFIIFYVYLVIFSV